MGRTRVFRNEQTTTISVFLADALLLDDMKKGKEIQPEAHRRIFKEYFGEDKIKQKQDEIRKKLSRQNLDNTGAQATIDSTYYPKGTYKDLSISHDELIEQIVTDRDARKDPLAKRYADDSIRRAITRQDVIVVGPKQYQLKRQWWKK